MTLISSFPLGGGEDRVTPPLSVPPGRLLNSQNYVPGREGFGYERERGYERDDGRPVPSAAAYAFLAYGTGTNAPTAGTTVLHGQTSGARGLVTTVGLASGTWSGTAAGTFTLAVISGSFVSGENLRNQAGTTTYAVATANTDTAQLSGAAHTAAVTAARDGMRGIVAAVPGAGAVLGVWTYSATLRAFRDHMVLSYDAGQNEPAVGATLTGATSTDTATVVGVHLASGSWAGNNAAGHFVIDSATAGDFQDNESVTITGPVTVGDADGVAKLAACMHNASLDGWTWQDTPLFGAGGSFEFVNHNFGAHAGTLKMYGVDGVSKAFEFDGTTLAFITSAMTVDKPTHLAARRRALYLSFSGGSVQNSSVGAPTTFAPVTGAGEFGVGDEITGFSVLRDDSLLVASRNLLKILVGSPGLADSALLDYSNNLGALANTLADAGVPVFADNVGLVVYSPTDVTGVWARDTASQQVNDLLVPKLPTATAALVSRTANLYRLFFTDKTGVAVGIGGTLGAGAGAVTGITSLRYTHKVECVSSGEDSAGDELLHFGSDNGFVYRLDSGHSFDGAAVPAFLRTVFDHQTALGLDAYTAKRFVRAFLQVEAAPGAVLEITPIFDWGAADKARHPAKTMTIEGGAGWVLGAGVLGTAVLGGSQVPRGSIYIEGAGSSIGLFVASNSATEEPHKLVGVTYELTPLRRDQTA